MRSAEAFDRQALRLEVLFQWALHSGDRQLQNCAAKPCRERSLINSWVRSASTEPELECWEAVACQHWHKRRLGPRSGRRAWKQAVRISETDKPPWETVVTISPSGRHRKAATSAPIESPLINQHQADSRTDRSAELPQDRHSLPLNARSGRHLQTCVARQTLQARRLKLKTAPPPSIPRRSVGTRSLRRNSKPLEITADRPPPACADTGPTPAPAGARGLGVLGDGSAPA